MTIKNYKKQLRIIFSSFVLVCLLVACGKESEPVTSDEEEPTTENTDQQENTSNTQEETTQTENDLQTDREITEDDGAKVDDIENTEPNESLKEDYLEKLNETKMEADRIEPEDSSTYALKAVEDYRYEIWDDLLNEIYKVLQEQLPPEKMEALRAEQREWIKYRDTTALEASKEYEGGTQEHLEYSAVLANLTEERSYELVESYMQ